MTTIDNRFVPMPVWLLEANVTPGALKLYAWLGKYANWDDGLCYPSRATLAERVGVKSARTIDGYIKELVAVGAIAVRHRTDDKGDPTSNEYHVITARPSGEGVAQSVAPPRAVDCATGSAVDCSLPRTITYLEKNTGDEVALPLELDVVEAKAPALKAKDEDPDGFPEFWTTYRARLGNKAGNRKRAVTAYRSARKTFSAEELLQYLAGYFRAKELERQRDGFTSQPPHAERWLRDQHWQNYADGQAVTPSPHDGPADLELGQDDVDRILGRDYWTPPAPPAGLDLLAERQWRADRVAEHQAQRRVAALARLSA